MKVVSIFNEKGGTGKTTLTMMVASCLYYMMNARVYVWDFDYPSFQLSSTRDLELDLLRNGELANTRPPSPDAHFYPVVKMNAKQSYSQKEISDMVDKIRRMKETREGYLFLDFPGHFTSTDASYGIAKAGLLDLIVYPVDSDRQSQTGAIMVNSIVNHPDFLAVSGRRRQEVMAVWNRVKRSEQLGKRDFYELPNETFKSLGIPVSSVSVMELLTMRRDSDTRNFVRSTVMFPVSEVTRLCPWIITLTMDIKDRLDGRSV